MTSEPDDVQLQAAYMLGQLNPLRPRPTGMRLLRLAQLAASAYLIYSLATAGTVWQRVLIAVLLAVNVFVTGMMFERYR